MTTALRVLLAVGVTAAAVTGGLVLPSADSRPPRAAAVGPPAAVPLVGPRPLRVLAAWEARRSAAWAAGDAGALTRLYLPGSDVGRADVRMLREYAARGLRVRGMTTQVLAWDLVRGSPGRLRLRVTDRVVAARADGARGSVRLPVDRPTRREVVLVRWRGGWRVARVSAAGRW